jgi:hypothetical protein
MPKVELTPTGNGIRGTQGSANSSATTLVQTPNPDLTRYRINGQLVTELTTGPGLTSSVEDGVAKLNPAVSLGDRYRRRTYLDDYVMGGQRCPPRIRALLLRASIICPLFARDRYWDSTDSVWRSRNYGNLGSSGGIIVGNSTTQTVQLKYTDEGKGVESNGGASLVRIPAAWIDTSIGFTVLVRYQRPLSHSNYSPLLTIGDVGTGSGNGRFHVRSLTTDVLACTTGNLGVPATSLNPRTIIVTANDAGPTAPLKVYVDGAQVATGNKGAGTLSGLDHLVGGFWTTGGVASPGRYWNILDIIVIPGECTAYEIGLLNESVQFPDSPAVDILTGQSNMVGPGKVSNIGTEPTVLPTLPIKSVAYRDETRDSTWDRGWSDCDTAPTEYFGPELTICTARPNRVVIKYGRGGTPSNAWTAVDTLYFPSITEYLMRALWTLSCKPRVENVVYMQGETDAESTPDVMTPALRQERLTAIAAMLRTGLNRTAAQCRFVNVRINSAIATFPSIHSFDNVRAGDAAFVAADANARLVDTDGLAYRANDLHYANQGILDAGTRIAAQMQTL